MREQDDDRFRLQPRPPRARIGPHGQRFLSRVLAEVSREGDAKGHVGTRSQRKSGARVGRGLVAARINGRVPGPQSRRVVVKARVVRLKTAGSQAVAAHLRYITRDGTTRTGEPGHAYDACRDAADLEAFEARGREDRHQFRFIVAPEDALQLEDLQGFTRDLMNKIAVDLGTRLDWVAVDHWDTDNPHTHLVLRGEDEAGRDLVITREYIGHGLRTRASELATELLGPRTELEIRAGMLHEVTLQRWTGLDRELQARSRDGVVDLRALPTDPRERYRRSLLLGRLQRLATLGLAQEHAAGRWKIRSDVEQTLRALPERSDIIRTMHRALRDESREFAIFDAAKATSSVVGRVAAKGLIDELTDRAYVILDGVDGRIHHVALGAGTDLADLPIGSVVEARGASMRAADRRIVALAEKSVYSTAVHLAELRLKSVPGRDPEPIVEAHVRRLEALRRAGIVERIEEGMWRVPKDLPTRGRAYDRQRLAGSTVDLLSHLPIDKQVRALGATWLDRQLVDGGHELSERGFGAATRDALTKREDFLVDQGFAKRRGGHVILEHNLLTALRNRDIDHAAKNIAAETGLAHRTLVDGDRVSGVYRRSIMLASGRFAMLDDGLGFSLVPWRPVVENRLRQHVSAALHGDIVSWQFGRQPAKSL